MSRVARRAWLTIINDEGFGKSIIVAPAIVRNVLDNRRSASALVESGPAARPTRSDRGFSRTLARNSDQVSSAAEERGTPAEVFATRLTLAVLHRLLTGCGHDCVVVTPSLIPVKAGNRLRRC